MKLKKFILNAAMLGGFGLLAACGGGGGGTTAAGPDGSSVSRGTITGFGSVYVNGTRYSTDGARITVDDEDASESDLEVGMVVTVHGRKDADGANGQAERIDYDDELEGIVISNDIAAGATTGALNIMGQIVNVSATTVFESKVAGIDGVDQIVSGNIVEVSGHADGQGTIEATRIEVKAADLATYLASRDTIEVKGTVGNLDTETFTIGQLTVNYAGAVLDDLPNGLANGLYVEVKSVAGLNDAGQLVASKVELENDGDKEHRGEDGDEFELEGVISQDLDGDVLEVNGQTVLLTEGTELEDVSREQLLSGLRVEVEGRFNEDGDLVAAKIEAEDDEHEVENEIKGVIETIDATDVNSGLITLMDGSKIRVTNETIMKDERDEGMIPEHGFNLSLLATNDYIEVDGKLDADSGEFIAAKLEREDP